MVLGILPSLISEFMDLFDQGSGAYNFIVMIFLFIYCDL